MTKNPCTRHLTLSESRAGAGFELAGSRGPRLGVVGEAQTVPPAGPSTRATVCEDVAPRRGRTLSSPVKNTPTVTSIGRDLMDETQTAQPAMTRRSLPCPMVGLEAIRDALRRVRAKTIVACVLLLTIGAAGTALAAEQDAQGDGGRPEVAVTALEVRGVRAPQIVRGTDGHWHIEYDLAITNIFTADVTLRSVEVLDGSGQRLLELDGEALAAVTTKFLSTTPTTTVPPSGAVQTVVDVVLPADRTEIPARLTHRVRYTFPPDALFHQVIGSRQIEGPVLEVERREPIVVAPPLRGAGWIAFNACCEPSSHRRNVLAANGSLVTPEVFAIDWVQARDGRLFQGDGSQNSQWYGHGAPILAAADGTVETVVDGIPEVPPGATTADNPTLTDASSFGGNHVIVRIGSGVYALYAHMITGSVRVKVGDRVSTGQELGLLGDSGNTTAPHLHFGLIDGLGVLSSDSLPFVIDRFTFQGIAEAEETGEVSITGSPREVREAHPLSNSVGDFSP
jgi:Peptidase family M23